MYKNGKRQARIERVIFIAVRTKTEVRNGKQAKIYAKINQAERGLNRAILGANWRDSGYLKKEGLIN